MNNINVWHLIRSFQYAIKILIQDFRLFQVFKRTKHYLLSEVLSDQAEPCGQGNELFGVIKGRECLEWLTNYKVFHILSSTLESLFSKNTKVFTCAICFYLSVTLLYHNSLVSRKLCQLPEANFRETLQRRYPDALEHKNHQRQIAFRGNECLTESNKAVTL